MSMLEVPLFGSMDTPIEVCDSAIQHYERMLEHLEAELVAARKQADSLNLQKVEASKRLQQWRKAKQTLVGVPSDSRVD